MRPDTQASRIIAIRDSRPFGQELNPAGPETNLAAFDALPPENTAEMGNWITLLRQFNVFFCTPLDLDFSMLCAFPVAYQVVEPGRQGPSPQGDPRTAVLGEAGRGDLYGADHDHLLRWYRYLFLGRGKPSTHVRVLSGQPSQVLADGAPEVLRQLLTSVAERVAQPPPAALVV